MLSANETNTHDWSTRRRTAGQRALRGEFSASRRALCQLVQEAGTPADRASGISDLAALSAAAGHRRAATRGWQRAAALHPENSATGRNLAVLRFQTPDAAGLAGVPGQGRHLALAVRIVGDQIVQAKFDANGCGVTIACGSALTELLIGRTISACRELTTADLVEALDGVPPDRGDCPAFALSALHSLLQTLNSEY